VDLRRARTATLWLLGEAAEGWRRDNAPRLCAALAYYTLFSLAPLLLVAIAIAGLVFGEQAAQGQIVAQLRGLLGETGALAVEQMVEHSRRPGSGLLATAIALLTLLLGASGVFGELKSALNVVWDVPESAGRSGLTGLLRDRLASFAMVLAVGFLLLVSLLASAVLASADGLLSSLIPGWVTALHLLNAALSLGTITVLFALIYKLLPDARIHWSDVWVGAAITAALFTAGKQLIGLYLGRSSFGSVYGAAGSLVVLIVWVYYAAQVFFFGAELTQAYARHHGSRAPGRDRPPSLQAGFYKSQAP
jgi:membrane protein